MSGFPGPPSLPNTIAFAGADIPGGRPSGGPYTRFEHSAMTAVLLVSSLYSTRFPFTLVVILRSPAAMSPTTALPQASCPRRAFPLH